MTLNNWEWAYTIYILVAITSFVPVILAIINQVKLNPGGKSFGDSPKFSDDNKLLLEHHYSRIYGTLIFWKNKAELNRRFHYYTLFWTIPISVLIPVLMQSINVEASSKLFLTIIASHSALLIAFHRALKIEHNYRAFRHGESEFYDTYRRLLDRPLSFGSTEEEQIENYFIEVEKIRKYVRNAETDNFPTIEDLKVNEKNK